MAQLKRNYDIKDSLPDIVQKNKENIIEIFGTPSESILNNFASKEDFYRHAVDGGLGTYEVEGHSRILLRYAGNVEEFLPLSYLTTYLTQINTNKINITQNHDRIDLANNLIGTNTNGITANANKIAANSKLIETAQIDIAVLKAIGSFKGTYPTLNDAITAIQNPLKGDYVLIGVIAPYTEYIYDSNWEQAGQVNHPLTLTAVSAQQDPKIAAAKQQALDESKLDYESKIAAAKQQTLDEVKTQYEPLSNDLTSPLSTVSVANNQGIITPPAGIDNIPVGQYVKLIIDNPTNPVDIPQDNYQMSLNGKFLWINKANGDIMSWNEIKNNVSNGDTIVLKRLDDTTQDGNTFKNFELLKWEIKKIVPHWETIDMTTYNFTKPEKLRITTKDGSHNTYINICFVGMENNNALINVLATVSDFGAIVVPSWYTWRSDKTNKDKMDLLTYMNDRYATQADFQTITKAELWKDT